MHYAHKKDNPFALNKLFPMAEHECIKECSNKYYSKRWKNSIKLVTNPYLISCFRIFTYIF